ncbi:MAG TPA: VOC family protein [Pyrinomonadaceae bacterium]|nr:VOC family protein [Pyrinomonadaceae bacterium]
MSKLSLSEKLDQAIELILAGQTIAPDPSIDELAEVAIELRALARNEFRNSLRRELEETAMSTGTQRAEEKTENAAVQKITPYLVVSDVHQEIDFIKAVFGATGKVYGLGSQGGFHSEYRIGDSMLMIGGGGKGANWQGTPLPASLHTYVQDVDGAYQLALQAGATSLMPPTDMEYGERGAAIEDPGGNHWYLATAVGPSYVPEGLPNVMPFFNPVGAPKMIDFLVQALGAEKLGVHEAPSGRVLHAKLRIGESIVEMGEAHGEWQPRPMQFMVYVGDSDAAYERAMRAEGAVSVSVPANAPYGGRTGSIKDPWGNTWYLSSPQQKKDEPEQQRRESMGTAKLFRVALQVADLNQAAAFYSKLLDDPGIPIPRGSRHYFNCGSVILALVDVAKGAGEKPQPTPDYIYFAVDNLEEVFERAQALDCLANDRYHDQNAGEILKRPWGELSFYCEDPWGNGLCFVDEKTLYTGK